MGIPFHESVYGHRFFDVQLPKLIQAINRLAEATETQNALTAEMKQKPSSVNTAENSKYVLVCGVKKLENKEWKCEGITTTCFSPRKALLWADQALHECATLGYTPTPERETAFLNNLISNNGDMLFLYKNGDSKSPDVMALYANGA